MQVVIVTPQGFPLAYEVMPGNTSDKTTLADFLKKIEAQYGRSDRVWIMDRGIPTEETLEAMRTGPAPTEETVAAVARVARPVAETRRTAAEAGRRQEGGGACLASGEHRLAQGPGGGDG